MAFRDFKSVDAVLAEYPLVLRHADVLPEVRLDVPEYLLTNLRFSLSRRTSSETEAFYTENFVYPLLHLVWMRYPRLHVWSHRPLTGDARLTGEPDYLVAPLPTGPTNRMVQTPLLAVAEAKRQDFDEGWGQCLAAMLACRVLNGDRPLVVYGVVSTGLVWEFGRLDGQVFTRQPGAYAITDPALVHGLLDQVFAACDRQLPPE